jgi:thiamine-phosphate pyrophosphorylase
MLKIKGRLYAITDEKLIARKDFLKKIAAAASAGAGIIQLREKASRLRDRLELAKEAVRTAHAHGARLVINDDPWLAAAIGADGVHLGRDDASVETSRALLGPGAIIGVSCYGDVGLALRMQREGADYVSFGACFRSPTKPKELLVPLSIFAEARRRLKVPLVAIGGINKDNAALVTAAGADLISVVSSVFALRETARAVTDLRLKIGDEK